MLVQTLDRIPEELLTSVSQEISQIDWESRPEDPRAKFAVFSDSQTIHIRTHKRPTDHTPTTINEWSMILDTVDNPAMTDRFPEVKRLAQWVYERVGGITMGRIMIINLVPHGKVALHIDPLDYFEKHSRYHVPVKTNPNVTFSGEPGTPKEHMSQGYLSRLNNRLPHRLDNDSDENRIHVLIDIETPDGNQIF